MHVHALGNEQVANGVADGDPPPTAGVERAGGVGGHELEIDLLAVQRLVLPVGVAGGHYLAQDVVQPRRREEEVEEARAGDIDPLQVRRRRILERCLDPVGDLAGRELRRLRHVHRDRARPVTLAAFRIAGLERDAASRLGKPGRSAALRSGCGGARHGSRSGSGDAQHVAVGAIVLPDPARPPGTCDGDQRNWRAGTVSFTRPRSSGARRRRLCRPSPQEPELATATSEIGALVP